MESHVVPDSAITASSSYNEQSVGPMFARLNSDASGGAWCPAKQLDSEVSGSEWIAVNLTNIRYTITGLATQGRFGNGMGVEFAEEYWIEYSRDGGLTWTKWRNRKGYHMIKGNSDTFTVKRTRLEPNIVGVNMVRIVPHSEHIRTVCLRFEFYGCPLKGADEEDGESSTPGTASDGVSSTDTDRLSRNRFVDAHRIFIFIGSGLLALTVSVLVIFVIIKLWMRVRRKKQPNFYSSVDVDFITGSLHHQHHHPYPGTTTLIGGTSTPVYCDPDQYITDYRNIANRGNNTVISMMPSRVTKIIDSSSNNVPSMDRYGRIPGDYTMQHQQLHHQMQQQQHEQQQLLHRSDSGLTSDERTIHDHEYAVPDIIYKESEVTSRLICNPLQEAVENLKNNTHHQQQQQQQQHHKGGSINSLGSSTSGRRHQRQPLQPVFNPSSARTLRFDV